MPTQTRIEQYTPRPQGTEFPTYIPGRNGNRPPWSAHSYPWLGFRVTNLIWTGHPSRRGHRLYQAPPVGARDYSYMMGGTEPLPDSPLEEVKCNWRRRGEYHEKGTSWMVAGQGDNPEGMDEGEEEETEERRVAHIEAQMALLRQENDRLQEDL